MGLELILRNLAMHDIFDWVLREKGPEAEICMHRVYCQVLSATAPVVSATVLGVKGSRRGKSEQSSNTVATMTDPTRSPRAKITLQMCLEVRGCLNTPLSMDAKRFPGMGDYFGKDK